MVDPERRDEDIKEHSLDYHKDSEDSSRKTEKSEKDPNNGGGGNIDSGYHSFGCPNRSPDMLTTSMGHEEDFPPPLPPRTDIFVGGYPPLPDRSAGKYNILIRQDINDVTDRGCNSLPDMNLFRKTRNATMTPVLRASDSNFHQQTALPLESINLDHEAELAKKIAFFFKLGYTADQVRTTLYKLGPRASKNDILMALGDFTSEASSLPTMTYSETNQVLLEGRLGETGSTNMNGAVELIPRGPSTVDDPKDDEANASDNLRPIVIDGSNVAMSHGNKEYFSCKGIQLTVQYFLDRGHRDITVFVPKYRKEQTRPDAPIKDQEILTQLQEEKILVWTPSRHVNGRRITCYDDRFILKLAQETDGVIVSNDNFRDLQNEKPEWKEVIEKRLLMYSFVNDRFMPPDDPLGRNGPSLDNFLRIRLSSEEKRKPECPYGKKCTYGKKCKYFHPECSSSQRSVSEQIKDESRRRAAPSSAAKNLASEVMKDSALSQMSPQHGAQSKNSRKDQTENRADDQRKRREDGTTLRHNKPHGEPRRTVSPLAGGACGSTHSATDHTASVHGAVAQTHDQLLSVSNQPISSLHADFNNMKLGPNFGDYPPNGASYMTYPYNESNSAGAEGRTHNRMPAGAHQMHMAPPALHSQVGRNVVSSTSPHQHLPHLNMQHHSSPPAISMYDQTGFMGHQHNHPQPMFQNLTYPAQQPFPQYPPQQQQYPQGYKPRMGHNDMIAYHQAMLQHHLLMHQSMVQDPHLLAPQSAPQMPQMPGYPYVYPPTSQQHPIQPQMVPASLTSPHNLDPSMYEQASRQVYSSPNPVNPHPIMPRQPNSHGYKMPTITQDQVSNTSQPQFRDPSSPRYYLYRNLCGLFNRSTVERVLHSHPHESDAKKLAKICLEMDS